MSRPYLLWKCCVLVSALLLPVAASGSPASTITSASPRSDKTAKKAVAPVTQEIPVLPLDNPARRNMIWLTTPVTDPRQVLIHRVEEKFASGEQNYKAGHLEAARKASDDAVDWRLQRGLVPKPLQ